jgi:glyoxylase-like metal-dependent hydrolase (beta-lactamase superfamily II)
MDYPFPEAPLAGELTAVRPGVFWLRMPLPFALDHINLWLLEDGSGWTLVDTGICLDEVKGLWRQLLAGPLAGQPLQRIIATHFHPDHLGLAGWLEERSGAPLWMTGTEWLMGSLIFYDAEGRTARTMVEFFRQNGLPEEWLDKLGQENRYRKVVSPPPPFFHRLTDGQQIEIGGRQWRVIVGRGHTPEHACLYCQELDLMISGDQVLPRITPNISVYGSEPDANPLQDFLDSMVCFEALPATTLVLPAHGFPFTGLHDRLAFLRDHHGDHFDEILAAFDQPRQAAEIIPLMFPRELDGHQVMFAMGECLAHLACLRGRGLLERSTRSDGSVHYRKPG